MITTKTIKLNRPDKFDNLWIENKLSELGFDVIRWAIVHITTNEIFLSISFSLKN
mgnify:CR=1 FL=1